ncbi:Uncharacterized protein MLTONO_6645 [Mesorhizobium loti]|nr:Uncharacterized protein MLTONO_6645 [Mesorhizobium loti]
MSGSDRLLLSLLIKSALLEKKGAEFERFFTSAAIEIWGEDFEPWKPQGRYGDFKCDGYRRSTLTVFQCNAPEQFAAREVEGKIERDFEGARAHFGNRMTRWIFVHNQRETPAKANELLHKLRERYPNIDLVIWTLGHLEREILALPNTALRNLIPGFVDGQEFSPDFDELLSRRYDQSTPPTPPAQPPPAAPANINALHDALHGLSHEDEEVRRRLLGYSWWFDPATKAEVHGRIAKLGHQDDIVVLNAQRLEQAGLIKVTDNHYLPIVEEVCLQAADSLMGELLQELDA